MKVVLDPKFKKDQVISLQNSSNDVEYGEYIVAIDVKGVHE